MIFKGIFQDLKKIFKGLFKDIWAFSKPNVIFKGYFIESSIFSLKRKIWINLCLPLDDFSLENEKHFIFKWHIDEKYIVFEYF